jgi:hypothetical protein
MLAHVLSWVMLLARTEATKDVEILVEHVPGSVELRWRPVIVRLR